MPIKSYKLKGSLTLGTTPLDVSCQVTEFAVNPTENVTTDDAIRVLCGQTLPASDTVDYTYTISGIFLQDLAAGGVLDFSWTNKGLEVPFEFIPDDTTEANIVGIVRPIPLKVGGNMTERPTSDFEWACVGEPTPTWDAVAAV